LKDLGSASVVCESPANTRLATRTKLRIGAVDTSRPFLNTSLYSYVGLLSDVGLSYPVHARWIKISRLMSWAHDPSELRVILARWIQERYHRQSFRLATL
jgi:hypothetical protein